jgi:hypothetical protein
MNQLYSHGSRVQLLKTRIIFTLLVTPGFQFQQMSSTSSEVYDYKILLTYQIALLYNDN